MKPLLTPTQPGDDEVGDWWPSWLAKDAVAITVRTKCVITLNKADLMAMLYALHLRDQERDA